MSINNSINSHQLLDPTAVPTFNGLIIEGNYSTVSFGAFVYPVQFLQSVVVAPGANVSAAGINILSTINAGAGSEISSFDSLLIDPSAKDGSGVIDVASGINVFAPSIGTTNYSARLTGDVQLNSGSLFMNTGDIELATGAIAVGTSASGISSGTIRSAPPSSASIINVGFPPTLTIGTPAQNTCGYDIMINVYLQILITGTSDISIGVGDVLPLTKVIAASQAITGQLIFSAIVPNNYYFEIDITGTYTQGNNVTASAL